MGLRKLDNIIDGIENIFAAFAALLVISAMVAVSFDVIIRLIFINPITGVSEYTEFALLFIPMLGAAWLLRIDGHVNIDMVTNYLSPGYFNFVSGMTSAVGTIVCGVITFLGAWCTWDNFQRGILTAGVVAIPRWILLIVIPVGFFLLGIESLRKTFSFFGKWKNLRSSESSKMRERG
jgi:C4-dicarboxylate transporter DctQ subunit